MAPLIREASSAAGARTEWLTIELTEGAVMEDVQAGHAVLTSLRELGCRVMVDDFGTGYSSLAHLRALPVDGLKIDRSFVGGMLTDQGDLAIVRAVIGLGREMRLTVVAEGVETDSIARALIAERCHCAQGLLMGEPMPVDALLSYLDGLESDADTGLPVSPVLRR